MIKPLSLNKTPDLLAGLGFFGRMKSMRIIPKIYAQGPQNWPDGPDGCQYGGVATIQGVECLLANVLSVTITLIGVVGFIMMMVGAFRYLISGGNSKETETASKTLTYAVIGLVVALASFIILNLIAEFTGVQTILDFQIPGNSTSPSPIP